MPFSTTTLVRFTAKLSRCLSLALLPALASEAHAIGQPQRKQNLRSAQATASGSVSVEKGGPVPYLAALGPLPLRFARPAPEPSDEPPAPPEPKVVAEVKLASPEAKDSAPKAQPENSPSAEPAAEMKPAEQTPEKPVAPPEPTYQPPLPILPDDTRRELHPEDVLPFFRYPAAPASGDASVEVVVPIKTDQSQSQPIPSSATYQQK